MVRMRHPKLPAEQVIEAQESQVGPYQHSGWVVVEDGPPADEAPPDGQGDPPPSTTEKSTTSSLPGTDKPRGQRASKGDS